MTDNDERIEGDAEENAGAAAQDVAALEAERDGLIDQLQRARVAASERVLRELLPVLDDLQDGLGHIPADQAGSGLADGMRLVEQKFRAALDKLGVQQVPAQGEPFDPAVHEAVDFDPAGGATVAAVYRQGYRLGDTLLRPAMVKVGQQAET